MQIIWLVAGVIAGWLTGLVVADKVWADCGSGYRFAGRYCWWLSGAIFWLTGHQPYRSNRCGSSGWCHPCCHCTSSILTSLTPTRYETCIASLWESLQLLRKRGVKLKDVTHLRKEEDFMDIPISQESTVPMVWLYGPVALS